MASSPDRNWLLPNETNGASLRSRQKKNFPLLAILLSFAASVLTLSLFYLAREAAGTSQTEWH